MHNLLAIWNVECDLYLLDMEYELFCTSIMRKFRIYPEFDSRYWVRDASRNEPELSGNSASKSCLCKRCSHLVRLDKVVVSVDWSVSVDSILRAVLDDVTCLAASVAG